MSESYPFDNKLNDLWFRARKVRALSQAIYVSATGWNLVDASAQECIEGLSEASVEMAEMLCGEIERLEDEFKEAFKAMTQIEEAAKKLVQDGCEADGIDRTQELRDYTEDYLHLAEKLSAIRREQRQA